VERGKLNAASLKFVLSVSKDPRVKRVSFYCPSSMGYRPHFKKWGIAHLHWRAAQVSAERIASQ